MQIHSLALKNFRSYARLGVQFSGGINILQGANAAGKTNVLEAIGLLSFGKSFRTGKDAECIREGAQSAYIKGEIGKAAGKLTIESALARDGKKSLKINSEPVRRMGELFGHFIAVVFAPEDLKVLKESPSLRRRFIDMEISKLRPAYFFALQEYQKALAQKNALLKSRMKAEQLQKLVAIYNEQMAEHGEKIISARGEFLARLEQTGQTVHDHLSGGEKLTLKYRASVDGEHIKDALIQKMERSLQSEIDQGFSLVGPHREDLSVYIGGAEVKTYSSQGQVRTAMLALKIATLEIARADFEENPVLLLDDVFSELDETRQKALLEYAQDVQCFITTAVPVRGVNGAVYTVENGEVKPK